MGTITNPRFYPSLGNPNPNIGTGSSNAIFDLGNTSAMLNNRNGGITIQLGALIGGPNTSPARRLVGEQPHHLRHRRQKSGHARLPAKFTEVIPSAHRPITKVGTGTFTLTGANTYTGPNDGERRHAARQQHLRLGTGTNSVTVNSGGTLGGNGFIFGPVIVNAGGALAPGSNGVGTLTLRSNLTLNAGAILNFEVGAGRRRDKIAVTNALALGGTLNVTNLAGFGPGTNTFFTYGGALSGTLADGQQAGRLQLHGLTNTAKQVRLVVAVFGAAPVWRRQQLRAAGLVISGNGGTASGNYYVLASTNLAPPLAAWRRVATNQFDNNGGFVFTNVWVTNAVQQFYRLQLP